MRLYILSFCCLHFVYQAVDYKKDINSHPSILYEDYVNVDQNEAACEDINNEDNIIQLKDNNWVEDDLSGKEKN